MTIIYSNNQDNLKLVDLVLSNEKAANAGLSFALSQFRILKSMCIVYPVYYQKVFCVSGCLPGMRASHRGMPSEAFIAFVDLYPRELFKCIYVCVQQ